MRHNDHPPRQQPPPSTNLRILPALWSILFLAIFPPTLAQAQPNRPNIIFLMADDLDVGSLETMLANNLLPNFKAYFVDQGIKFEESFVTNALCCPSRATFLSGQYTHNHRTRTNVGLNGSVLAFKDATALPTWLRAAGYRTAHIGKYLNGYGILSDYPQLNDLAVQTCRWLKICTWNTLTQTYIPPGWNEWYGLLDVSTYCTYNFEMNENGKVTTYFKNGRISRNGREVHPPFNDGQLHNYQTDVLADHAVNFIHRANDATQPFFLTILPLAPHVEACGSRDPDGPTIPLDHYKDQFKLFIRPAQRHLSLIPALRDLGASLLPSRQFNGTTSFNEPDLSGKPRELRKKLQLLDQQDEAALFQQYAHRLASLVAIDDLIGRVVAQLQANGQLENTIIFFTSDNGWFYGEHRLSSKHLAYEEAIRVPLYVRMPGSNSGRTLDHLTLNNDLAPTIAALAGAQPTRTVDGRSFAPLLLGEQPLTWRKQFLVEHYLGAWPGAANRVLDFANLFAVRTGTESAIPDRTYIEHYDGIQKNGGYFLNETQRQPSGDYVWHGTLLDTEYYDLASDPLQVRNLFYNLASNPDRQEILTETDELKTWLHQLLLCKGSECRQLEDQ